MSDLPLLLGALVGVRARPSGCDWWALCPVHRERTPSLSLKLLPDGAVLVHCFGCGANGLDVCAALQLPSSALFPERLPPEYSGPVRRPPHDPDILATAAREALVVAAYVEAGWRGDDLSFADEDRCAQAVRRLHHFAELAK